MTDNIFDNLTIQNCWLYSSYLQCNITIQHSTVEEGRKQMSSVQDDVMKRMEQYVDQLTTGNNSDVIITSSLMMSLFIIQLIRYHYLHRPQELQLYKWNKFLTSMILFITAEIDKHFDHFLSFDLASMIILCINYSVSHMMSNVDNEKAIQN